MENKSIQTKTINELKNIDNIDNIRMKYLSNDIKILLSNEDYKTLFYNSKNNGLNKNFPLNVIYNKKKSKNTK